MKLILFSDFSTMLLSIRFSNGIRYYSTKSVKRKEILDRIIRVDHAGELGADRIYAGQMAVLGK